MSWQIAAVSQFKWHVSRSSFHIYLKHKINMNEHQKVFYVNRGKVSVDISSLSPLKFICSSIWFVCQTKMADSILGLVRICQSSSLQTVSWAEQWQYLYNINTVIKLNWINWLWIQSTNNQIVTLLPYWACFNRRTFQNLHIYWTELKQHWAE